MCGGGIGLVFDGDVGVGAGEASWVPGAACVVDVPDTPGSADNVFIANSAGGISFGWDLSWLHVDVLLVGVDDNTSSSFGLWEDGRGCGGVSTGSCRAVAWLCYRWPWAACFADAHTAHMVVVFLDGRRCGGVLGEGGWIACGWAWVAGLTNTCCACGVVVWGVCRLSC